MYIKYRYLQPVKVSVFAPHCSRHGVFQWCYSDSIIEIVFIDDFSISVKVNLSLVRIIIATSALTSPTASTD